MNSPELYLKISGPQSEIIKYLLDTFKDELTWTEGEKILEIGCGPGRVAASLLTEYVPQDCNIIGCDKSEAMYRYATKNYTSEKLNFCKVDIERNNTWIDSNKQSFDKIFSFYYLHWIKSQGQATRNMNDMLKQNGEMLTMFILSHPFFIIYKNFPEFTKWKPFIKPLQTWDIFYNYSEIDKKNEYIKLLQENNFKIISCSVQEGHYLFNSMDNVMDLFDVMNPFKESLPENKYEEFIEDCKDFLELFELLAIDGNGKFVLKYKYIVTLAKKNTYR